MESAPLAVVAIDIPIGRFAVVTDPDGASMTLSSFRDVVGGVGRT